MKLNQPIQLKTPDPKHLKSYQALSVLCWIVGSGLILWAIVGSTLATIDTPVDTTPWGWYVGGGTIILAAALYFTIKETLIRKLMRAQPPVIESGVSDQAPVDRQP